MATHKKSAGRFRLTGIRRRCISCLNTFLLFSSARAPAFMFLSLLFFLLKIRFHNESCMNIYIHLFYPIIVKECKLSIFDSFVQLFLLSNYPTLKGISYIKSRFMYTIVCSVKYPIVFDIHNYTCISLSIL